MINLMDHQKQALADTAQYNRCAIKGYEGLYEIDTEGNVYSVITTSSRRKRVIKPHIKNGYLAVDLTDYNGICKHHYLHRLVAKEFIPNPNNYNYVDHIDCNKCNNKVENLEWVSQKENIRRSKINGLQSHHYYKCWVNDTEYESMKEASLQVFGVSWLIKHLHSKFGNEFTYKGKSIKVVMSNV